MKQECIFNSEKDLQEVVPGLSTDLALAMEHGVVMDTGITPEYNLIDDPVNIRGRVGDAFDAINAQKAILQAGKIPATTNSVTKPVTAGTTASQSVSTPPEG